MLTVSVCSRYCNSSSELLLHNAVGSSFPIRVDWGSGSSAGEIREVTEACWRE